MKVKCISINRLNKEGLYRSIKIGKEYVVLAVEFYNNSISTFSQAIGDYVLYRIKDDEGNVMPFPSKIFEIISEEIPLNWVIYCEEDGSCSLLPKQWARNGFWDDYYNYEDSAVDSFKSEEKTMLQE